MPELELVHTYSISVFEEEIVLGARPFLHLLQNITKNIVCVWNGSCYGSKVSLIVYHYHVVPGDICLYIDIVYYIKYLPVL